MPRVVDDGTDSDGWYNDFARLTTGSGVAAEEASLAMPPAGDTLYSVWAQERAMPDGTAEHDARFARLWYTDTNFTTITASSSGGCTTANGECPDDPVLPLPAGELPPSFPDPGLLAESGERLQHVAPHREREK